MERGLDKNGCYVMLWYVILNFILGGILTIVIIISFSRNSKSKNKKQLDCMNCKHLKVKYRKRPSYGYKYYCSKGDAFDECPEYCNKFTPIYNREFCVGCNHAYINDCGEVKCKFKFEHACFNNELFLKNSEVILSTEKR